MVIVLELDFEDYQDFDDFLKKHKKTINRMGEGEKPLTKQIREQVRVNEQFPEHFKFTTMQLNQMYQRDSSGMSQLLGDGRVTIKRDGE